MRRVSSSRGKGRRARVRQLARRLAWCALALMGLVSVLAAQKPGGGRRTVVMLTVNGDVNPVLVGYLQRGLHAAERQSAEMLLVRLDTPGGQLESTRQIARDFLASKVPIGVYVWPAGARAGSAGTFITMGAQAAGMAPQTNIGAAHPVFGGPGEGAGESEDAKTLSKKITNDSVALIRNLAEMRGRDANWAEKAVRESASITVDEAVRLHVVDFLAQDPEDFLRQADGMRVKTSEGERILHTAGAQIVDLPLDWRERLLYPLANPNIAYILMMLGIYALILELKSPTHGAAGAFGAICLIVALFSLSVLDVNYAGLALILVGVGFLVADLIHHTHGVLTLGGVTALTVGSLILTKSPTVVVSRPLIAGVVVATVLYFVFCLGAIMRSQKRKVVTGATGMVGLVGEARTALDPEGTVFVEGAWWSATTSGERIEAGIGVEVVAVDGLRLTVRRAAPPAGD